MNIEKIIYKTTGIMSKKQIMQTCTNIGSEISKNLVNGENITAESINAVLIKNIGRKNARKIRITDNADSFKKLIKQELDITDEYAKYIYQNSKSAIIPCIKSNTSVLNLRINTMKPQEIVNTSTHELEHVLNQVFSFKGKMKRLSERITGKKFIQNYRKKYTQITTEKNFELQNDLIQKSKLGIKTQTGLTKYKAGLKGLLKQTGLKSKEGLDKAITEAIRANVLLPNNEKQNLKILKSLKFILKDESQAYKAGGEAELNFIKLTGIKPSEKITKSEMLAQIYDETIDIIKKEIRILRRNKLRNFISSRDSKLPT